MGLKHWPAGRGGLLIGFDRLVAMTTGIKGGGGGVLLDAMPRTAAFKVRVKINAA